MSESIVKLVNIPQYGDERGSLSVAEYNKVIPFLVRRIYWIYGTKKGVSRGFHAHKKLHQLCVCVSGSARLVLFDGVVQEEVVLNNPSKGLLIGPDLWHEMYDFTPDCVLVLFAEAEYDESDYIRNREEFIRYVHSP